MSIGNEDGVRTGFEGIPASVSAGARSGSTPSSAAAAPPRVRADAGTSDVLVIGGGPAGSTIAALLGDMGWRVTLLEKARHPRFHIGESLLPCNMPIFERLDIMDDVKRIGVVKRAIDFTLPPREDHVTFDFSVVDSIPYRTAFQVHRAEFDHLLIRTAAARGAHVVEGVEATDVRFGAEVPVTVSAIDETGAERVWQADFLVDASGRNTFLADRLRLKERNPRHNSAAIFAHFAGARRRPGDAAGNISVYWFDGGWIWMIPLTNDVISVGVVGRARYLKTRTTTTEQFFLDTLARCPPVAERLDGARIATPVTATGNYSYASREMYGENHLMIGDSYAFIDPVFSSGVYFAMFSAALGAETIDSCLRQPSRKRVYLRRHARTVRRGLNRLSWFIYRFTSPAMKTMFMAPSDAFNMRRAVLTMLAGDVFQRSAPSLSLVAFKGIYYFLTVAGAARRARN